VPFTELLLRGDVVQAQHRQGVPRRRQVADHLGPDALAWGIGRDQIGIAGLDFAQLLSSASYSPSEMRGSSST